MRTAKSKTCPKCGEIVMRLTQKHLSGECSDRQDSAPQSDAKKRKVVMRDCKGCGKPFGRLRKSGMCAKCEIDLLPEQRAAIEATQPQPKETVAREVVIGGKYQPMTYFAEVLGTSLVDDETVVEYRLNGGSVLYANLPAFLRKFRLV